MKVEILLIPEYDRLDESVAMAEKYHAHFEYNDFYFPSVYMNQDEIDKRVERYLSCNRDAGMDTMHGAFLDLVLHSSDPKIAEYSKQCMRKSMEIAKRLGVKGVIFHTELIAGFKEYNYVSNWITKNAEFFRDLCTSYPDIQVYMENMFDLDYELIWLLANQMTDVPNFGICLDYAHAAISNIKPVEWLKNLAPFIKHMHINDNDFVNDLHLTLGKGQIDWLEFRTELKTLLENEEMKEMPSILLELKSLESFEESIGLFQKLFD